VEYCLNFEFDYSGRNFGGASPLLPQPLYQVVGTASIRRIQWRKRIVSNPVQICASLKKILCCGQLPAMAGAPKSACDLLWWGWRITCETFLNTPI
jgi:hypothetical protein